MMSRQKKAGAISALFVGSLMLAILLASADMHVSAIARLQTATITPTPCDEEDQLDCEDDQTATAEIYFENQTETALVITPGTATTTATAGTATATSTSLSSPTTSTVIVTPAPSPQPATPVVPAQQLAPTETPTEIPDEVLTCYPGQPLVISGDGPPRAAYLVYFGQRVVSGGSVAPSGRFATTLMIGRERAGVYPIVVRVRGTSQVLLELSCAVPDVTPTFVPRARTLP